MPENAESKGAPTAEDVWAQVDKIRKSKYFRESHPQKGLLHYLVGQGLEFNAVKETEISHALFEGRKDIVRVHVGNLRRNLDAYYGSEGWHDRVRIAFPTGVGYKLVFEYLEDKQQNARLDRSATIGNPTTPEAAKSDTLDRRAEPPENHKLAANLSPLARFDDSVAEGIERVYYRRNFPSTLRLYGSHCQFFTGSKVDVHYDAGRIYLLPDNERHLCESWIMRQEAEKRSKGKSFFNGPTAQLLHFVEEGEGTSLDLYLGPIGWHDYSAMNERYSGVIQSAADYNKYIGLNHILSEDDFKHSKMTNILCCAATLVTSDGFTPYQVRSDRLSSKAGGLTCSVAENMNRWLDEADATDTLIRPWLDKSRAEDNSYQPERGVPNPFWTVARGIYEELSPRLFPMPPTVSSYIRRDAIKFTGIAYNLIEYQPNALFVVPVDCTRDQLHQLCEDNPGTSRERINIDFTKMSFEDPTTAKVLEDPRWTSGGKASMIRAIELMNALQEERGLSWRGAFDLLADER